MDVDSTPSQKEPKHINKIEWNPQADRRVGKAKATLSRSIFQELSQINTSWNTGLQHLNIRYIFPST